MKYSLGLTIAMGLVCAVPFVARASQTAGVADVDRALLAADRAAFPPGSSSIALKDTSLDPDFTWTDSTGHTLDKSEVLREIKSGKRLPIEVKSGNGEEGNKTKTVTIGVHSHGQVGIVQEGGGKVYTLRVWVKRNLSWRLLVYQAVSIGASPSAEAGTGACENPCIAVPFQPRNGDERNVIHTYQAVERAVTAHDSAAWGAHIAEEFFAVTSNSDRPLDKAARMAGLDSQKVGGIAPFPLVSARMFEVGDAMVMISRQQPKNGLRLRVTRIWIKRNGAWLEAYSYQTTIRPRFIG